MSVQIHTLGLFHSLCVRVIRISLVNLLLFPPIRTGKNPYRSTRHDKRRMCPRLWGIGRWNSHTAMPCGRRSIPVALHTPDKKDKQEKQTKPIDDLVPWVTHLFSFPF